MLMRDLQPILSYTVDEAMAYAPAGCVDHQKYAALLDWYKSPITFDEANEFEGVLEASLELRSAVTKALEDARSAGTFTKSQQVRVKAVVPAEMYALPDSSSLRFTFWIHTGRPNADPKQRTDK